MSGCSPEDQQVYDRCSQYLSKLLDFGTVFTTQEFSNLALSISRSDLTIILSKDSPLLVPALQYVRLVLMYHKIHVNMTFLLARMLSLINSLKGAPAQYATALDLTIDNSIYC
ncbi:Prefoldin subunit 5 [Giardia duodenalis]|uniref:Prefoldin subunit 5 n=1 Tax=Giardia intestinalis TaxID=5741 RepID=V6TZA3_GIAIN|nr:Prefoldin subunit 5 [Giardia intestinalis]